MPNPPPGDTIALKDDTFDKLRNASSATVATLLFKRGYQNAYVQGAMPLASGKGTMVGEAYTLRYIPTRPDTDPLDAFREPDHPQRVAISALCCICTRPLGPAFCQYTFLVEKVRLQVFVAGVADPYRSVTGLITLNPARYLCRFCPRGGSAEHGVGPDSRP